MKPRSFRYYIREAASSLVKNRLMTVASILTVASCIFIVSVFYCVAANIEFFMSQIESSIEITVFVDDSLDADDIMPLSDKITAIPHVVAVRYITPKEALEGFRQTLNDDGILAGLEKDNPLPRSFNIEIDDLSFQSDVIQALKDMEADGIRNIQYNQELVDVMVAVSKVVNIVCGALILLLATVSIVIITNTVRITVNARKTEINIMKYVGATDWFIRWPFMIEGVLIGTVGGLIPAAICWATYNRFIFMIKEWLPIIDFVQFRAEHDIFAYLFPFCIVLGLLIGMAGSVFSIRRHLQV